MMGAIDKKLNKEAIENVAAYCADLAGATGATPNSKPPSNVRAKRVKLPANLDGFTHYLTFNHKRRKQLRKVYANKVALDAAKAGKSLPDGSVIVVELFKTKKGPGGKPITGADGFYVADGPAGFTAMARQSGWGNDFPKRMRNEDWHYGVFKPNRAPVPVNQATCLSCHLPLAKTSYVFTLKDLKAAAK